MEFIKLPILLYDKKMDDLIGKSEDIPVDLYIKKDKIVGYRKALNEDMQERSSIYIEGGDSFLIELTITELEKKIK